MWGWHAASQGIFFVRGVGEEWEGAAEQKRARGDDEDATTFMLLSLLHLLRDGEASGYLNICSVNLSD